MADNHIPRLGIMTPDQYNIDHTDSVILLANDSNGELLQRVPAILEAHVDRQAWNRVIEDINATCVKPFVQKAKCYKRLFCALPLVMIGSFAFSMATVANEAPGEEVSITNFVPIFLAMLGVPFAFCAIAREIARVGEQAKVVLLSKLNEVNASKQFPTIRLQLVILQKMVNTAKHGPRAVDTQHILAKVVEPAPHASAFSTGASAYPSEKHFATQQPAPSAPAAIDAAPVQPGNDFDPPSNAAASALSDELERLSDLRQQGMLTEEEFAAAKRRALGL